VQNNFGLADAPLSGGGFPRRNGDIEPLDVFDRVAAVANKVMVAVQIGVVARGLAFPRHLADQTGLGEIAQAVVNGGAGDAGIAAVERVEDFIGGGVDGLAHQELQHVAALRGGAETDAVEVLIELGSGGAHMVRLNLNLDFVNRISRI
jgi:hypothetical protein